MFFILIFTMLLVGCNGSENTSSSENHSAALLRIDIVASPIATKGASLLKLAKGNVQAFIATGYYSDGTVQDITNIVSWATSKVTIATVTSAGLLTGIDAGVTNIVATQDGITSNSLGLEVTRWVSVPAVADYLVPDFVARNKADADAYCDSIQIDGSRWRVPSKDE